MHQTYVKYQNKSVACLREQKYNSSPSVLSNSNSFHKSHCKKLNDIHSDSPFSHNTTVSSVYRLVLGHSHKTHCLMSFHLTSDLHVSSSFTGLVCSGKHSLKDRSDMTGIPFFIYSLSFFRFHGFIKRTSVWLGLQMTKKVKNSSFCMPNKTKQRKVALKSE